MFECEICKKKTDFIKKHHINSKSLGGCNKPYNIAEICSECHDEVHNGIKILEGKFTALNKDNRIMLIWRYFNEESITGLSDPEVWLTPNHKTMQNKFLERKQFEW